MDEILLQDVRLKVRCLARQKIFRQTHWFVIPDGIGEYALPGNFMSCQRNGLKIYQPLVYKVTVTRCVLEVR